MNFWTDAAAAVYAEVADAFEAGAFTCSAPESEPVAGPEAREEAREAAVAAMLRARLKPAIDADDPETVYGLLRFADAYTDSSAQLRFDMGILAIAAKRYRVAYAAWDDGGRAFFSSSADPEFQDGGFAGRVIRDLCGAMHDLQARVMRPPEGGDAAARGADAVDGELAELLGRLVIP